MTSKTASVTLRKKVRRRLWTLRPSDAHWSRQCLQNPNCIARLTPRWRPKVQEIEQGRERRHEGRCLYFGLPAGNFAEDRLGFDDVDSASRLLVGGADV